MLEAENTEVSSQSGKPESKLDASELPVFDTPQELVGPEKDREVYELESGPTGDVDEDRANEQSRERPI